MTQEDAVYGAWLDLLGSGTDEGPVLTRALHELHDRAEASHDPTAADQAAAEQDAVRLGTEA